MTSYQDYGLSGFFGQDETVAGRAAGERLKDEGKQKVLCVIHEQGNSSQEARCDGVRDGLGGEVELLYVNGQDLTVVGTYTVREDPGYWLGDRPDGKSGVTTPDLDNLPLVDDLITTEATVAELPEDKAPAAAGGPPGGFGGSDDALDRLEEERA